MRLELVQAPIGSQLPSLSWSPVVTAMFEVREQMRWAEGKK